MLCDKDCVQGCDETSRKPLNTIHNYETVIFQMARDATLIHTWAVVGDSPCQLQGPAMMSPCGSAAPHSAACRAHSLAFSRIWPATL